MKGVHGNETLEKLEMTFKNRKVVVGVRPDGSHQSLICIV